MALISIGRRAVDRLALTLSDRPTDLVLDVSTRCNLNCAMCSLKAYGSGQHMDLDTVAAIGPALDHFRHISLTCSGEPFLNPHIMDILAYVKSHSKATTDMFTNGTLLTANVARDLVRLGLDRIVVSLDAATGETYAAIRGSRLDRTLENVRSLVRAKREMGSARPFLWLGFVAMKRNADELPSVIGLAAELGAAEVRVHGLEPYSEEMASEITYGHGSDTYRHHFEKAVDEAGRLGVGLALPRLEIGPQRRCHPPAHVAWDGTVVPCGETVYARPFYFLKAKREHREVSFGNVREKDFRTIWDSHQYKHFRRSLRRRNFPAACDDCLMSYGVIC